MKNLSYKVLHVRSGFGIFEVLVAVAIVGVMITSILFASYTSFSNLTLYTERIQTFFTLQYTLVQTQLARKSDKKTTSSVTPGQIATTYHEARPQKNSALFPFKNLNLEQMDATIQTTRGTDTIAVVDIAYKAEKERE